MHLDDPDSVSLHLARTIVIRTTSGEDGLHEVLDARRADGGRWIVSISGVASRAAAAGLTGAEVMVARDILGLGEHELLVADLPGREVTSGSGVVGRVVSVYFNGAHDVLVVETAGGWVDVPLVEDHVAGPDPGGRLLVEGFADFAEMAYRPPGGRGT